MLAQGNIGFLIMRQSSNEFPSPNPHGPTGALPVVGAMLRTGIVNITLVCTWCTSKLILREVYGRLACGPHQWWDEVYFVIGIRGIAERRQEPHKEGRERSYSMSLASTMHAACVAPVLRSLAFQIPSRKSQVQCACALQNIFVSVRAEPV